MQINSEFKRFRLTGITALLGSQPASQNLHEDYIMSKAPKEKDVSDEIDIIKLEEKGLTVFARDASDEEEPLALIDYQIKGFFKEVIYSLKSDLGITAAKKKCDNYLFVEPRFIPIMRDGEVLVDEDEYCQRPLRAQTMQGERVTIASSEAVQTPWQIEFEVELIHNESTTKSKPITWDAVYTALDYGRRKGLGQFRNGGYGKFRWEEIEA